MTTNTTRTAIDALEEMRERVEGTPPTAELQSQDMTRAIKAAHVLDHADATRTPAEVAEVRTWRKWLHDHALPTTYRP